MYLCVLTTSGARKLIEGQTVLLAPDAEKVGGKCPLAPPCSRAPEQHYGKQLRLVVNLRNRWAVFTQGAAEKKRPPIKTAVS